MARVAKACSFASSIVGLWLQRYVEIYPSIYAAAEQATGGEAAAAAIPLPFGLYEVALTLGFLGLWGLSYLAFMNAFPRMRVFMLTSKFRDEIQVPVDPKTMEPLPAHE